MRERKSIGLTFTHAITIGLAFQFHMSAFMLAFISLFLFYRKQILVNWWGLALAVLVTLLSIFPFMLAATRNWWLIQGYDYGGKYYFGRSLVHVYPVLKSMLYWMRYPSFLFSSDLLAHVRFEWLAAWSPFDLLIRYAWRICLYIVGLATLFISVKANWEWFKTVWATFRTGGRSDQTSIEGSQQWISTYAAGALLAVIASAVLSPITFNAWHLIIVFPAAMIPVLIYLSGYLESGRFRTRLRSRSTLVLLCTFLVAVNLVGSHDSKRFSYSVSYPDDVRLQLFQLQDRR